jgi:outer membrane lipase/esterase
VYFDGVLNYASNSYDQKRNISYTVGSTTINETARAKPDGRLLALSLGGGYEHAFANGVSVEGSLRLRYLDTTVDGYTESGAGALNLAIDDQNTSLFTSSLGGRAAWPVSFKWGVLIPQFDLSWEHDFDGGAHKIKGSFAADQFQNQFVFKTDEEDTDYFTSGLGLSAVMPGGTTAFVQYQTTLGKDHFRDWNVALGGRIEFN